MRVWNVHPKYLDNRRVLDEHRTIHALLTSLSRDHSIKPNGIVGVFWKRAGYLALRHWLLAIEMAVERGFSHDSPIAEQWEHIPGPRRGITFLINIENVRRDIEALESTWQQESCEGGRVSWSDGPTTEMIQLVEEAELKGLPDDVLTI